MGLYNSQIIPHKTGNHINDSIILKVLDGNTRNHLQTFMNVCLAQVSMTKLFSDSYVSPI